MGQSPLSGETGFSRPSLKNVCFIAMGQTSSYILNHPQDCLAMLFVLALVRVVGAKRARTFAQVLTALFPITIYLSSQLPNLLKGSSSTELIWFRL